MSVARERPVLLLEPVGGRHHLVRDELLGRPGDQPVLVGELFGREDRVGRNVLDEPGCAAGCRCCVVICPLCLVKALARLCCGVLRSRFTARSGGQDEVTFQKDTKLLIS